jgi:ABC-type uncharacterized transport system substrate-binding protein
VEYPRQLEGLIHGLAELGWIPRRKLPTGEHQRHTNELWQFLSRECSSEYIEFVADGYYSAEWDPALREYNRGALLNRLREQKDIDFVIAMGTWAGIDLRDGHSVPTMVVSTTDPVSAGIIDSPGDSGRDHLHAKCDPDKYRRQVRAFYNIVRFRRLGVLADGNGQGHVYANLPDIRTVAGEMGFDVVVVDVRDTDGDIEGARGECARGMAELAGRVDAVWLTDLRGTQANFLPDVIKPLLRHRIPSWSTLGPAHVERGVLMGMTEENMRDVGLFHARTMARIFHGARPRDLPQIFEDRKALVVNLEVARRIGYDLPPALPLVADETYEEILGE